MRANEFLKSYAEPTISDFKIFEIQIYCASLSNPIILLNLYFYLFSNVFCYFSKRNFLPITTDTLL